MAGKKPINSRELARTIIIGVIKGVAYYIIYYIVLFGILIYYLVPYLLSYMGEQSINLDLGSLFSFSMINYYVLAWFIGLSVAGAFLVRHVPYGKAMDYILGIVMLYIVMLSYNFGVMSGYIGEYKVEYIVDLSPLFKTLFIIIAAFTVGEVFVSVAREYKKRKEANIHMEQ